MFLCELKNVDLPTRLFSMSHSSVTSQLATPAEQLVITPCQPWKVKSPFSQLCLLFQPSPWVEWYKSSRAAYCSLLKALPARSNWSEVSAAHEDGTVPDSAYVIPIAIHWLELYKESGWWIEELTTQSIVTQIHILKWGKRCPWWWQSAW